MVLSLTVLMAGVNRSTSVADEAPPSETASATDEPSSDSDSSADVTAEGEAVPAEEAPTIDELAWEVRPYRVLVSLALADRAVMSDKFARSTIDSLDELISGMIGSYWQPEFQINDWLFPQSNATIKRLTDEELTARYEPTEFDKVLVVVVEPDGPSFRLTGCEWARTTRKHGPIVQRSVIDRRRLPAVIFELLWALFRPIARIDMTESGFCELKIRGGELLSPESHLFPFHTGDLLTAYFRYLDRDHNVRQIQPVPWTYLRVEGVTRSLMTATIETAFSSPLSGSRRRVELRAMQVQPAYPYTKLSLSPRTNPNQPLVGVRVRVYEQLPSESDPSPPRIDLMTDRSGTVSVPTSSEKPLQRLIIHSGGAVLSNVPFVPGIEPEMSMQLPDDSPRLQVEGNLAMVQGDLIDIVSRRAVMLARALSQARKEKFEEADKLLAEVDSQPSIASFNSRILAIRVPAVDQARANRDRSQEKRILIMCKEVEDLVEKYLDRDKVKEVKIEIEELKKIAGT